MFRNKVTSDYKSRTKTFKEFPIYLAINCKSWRTIKNIYRKSRNTTHHFNSSSLNECFLQMFKIYYLIFSNYNTCMYAIGWMVGTDHVITFCVKIEITREMKHIEKGQCSCGIEIIQLLVHV